MFLPIKLCFGRAWICVTVNTKVFCEYDVTVSNKIIIIMIKDTISRGSPSNNITWTVFLQVRWR